MIRDHSWVTIVLNAIGALLLAWALKHPRAPEGTDPEYWTRRLRAGVRRLRVFKRLAVRS